MSSTPSPKLGPEFLTVIIKDSSPVWLENQPVRLRSVRVKLTLEQREKIKMHYTYTGGGEMFFEEISQIIVEADK